MVTDGWHTARGSSVYVKGGKAVRAKKHGSKSANVYQYNKSSKTWNKTEGKSWNSVKTGIYKGKYKVM